MDFIEKTIDSYNKSATEYSKNVESLTPLNEIFFFNRKLAENAEILDLGCGSDRDAKKFEELGLNVTGIDLSEELLNIARIKSPNSTFRKMDIRDLEFKKNSFDGVWASASLLHIPKKDIKSCLKNVKNVLRSSGYFYISLKIGEGEELKPDDRYNKLLKYWAYYQESEIFKLLKEIEFSIIKHSISKKNKPYQTHSFLSIFARN